MKNSSFSKAIFLDKDGTLIEDVPYNVNPKSIRLVPFAYQGLQVMQNNGFKIFIFSNQSGIAKGYFTILDLEKVFKTIQKQLAPFRVKIDAFYFCPHHPEGVVKKYAKVCNCRKPKIGLLTKAQKDFNLDLKNCWVIGDILGDIEAGNRAGCRSVLVDNGNETEWLAGPLKTPDYKAKDLLDAANFIIQQASESFTKRENSDLERGKGWMI